MGRVIRMSLTGVAGMRGHAWPWVPLRRMARVSLDHVASAMRLARSGGSCTREWMPMAHVSVPVKDRPHLPLSLSRVGRMP